jgi:hypothetical protein
MVIARGRPEPQLHYCLQSNLSKHHLVFLLQNVQVELWSECQRLVLYAAGQVGLVSGVSQCWACICCTAMGQAQVLTSPADKPHAQEIWPDVSQRVAVGAAKWAHMLCCV